MPWLKSRKTLIGARHDDIVDDANLRVKLLISICSSSANLSKHKAISRRLSQLEKAVRSVCDSIISLNVRLDVCLIRQCEERLQVHKMDLRELSASILTICLEDSEELYACQNGLEKLILENDLIVKKLLVSGIPSTTSDLMHISTSEGKGVSLPKLQAPTFDGKFTS